MVLEKTLEAKGTFHAKMGSIKDRNGMDLTEAEDIKKRWQEYTEELYPLPVRGHGGQAKGKQSRVSDNRSNQLYQRGPSYGCFLGTSAPSLGSCSDIQSTS